MRINKIKKSFLGALSGIIIGIILGRISSKLCIVDNVLLVIALLISAVVIILIITDDLEIRLSNAYRKGQRCRIFPYSHANCRHTYKPYEDE